MKKKKYMNFCEKALIQYIFVKKYMGEHIYEEKKIENTCIRSQEGEPDLVRSGGSEVRINLSKKNIFCGNEKKSNKY